MIRATVEGVWRRARTRSRREWLLWILARLILISIPVALWDPALIALVLDTEMVGLILTFGLAMTTSHVSTAWCRVRSLLLRHDAADSPRLVP